MLGYHHAEQAQLAHLRHYDVIDPARLLPERGVGDDLSAGKIASHVANHALFFCQLNVVHQTVLLFLGAPFKLCADLCAGRP
ncbi:hypothetical protein D9M69_643880 [compost metagenome]